MQARIDSFRGFSGDDGGEGFDVGLLDAAEAAEVLKEAGSGALAYAGDGEQLGVAVAHFAALAVVGDGEAVRLVTDALDEVQYGGTALEDNRIVFLSVEVDQFFAFCDGGERLRGEAEFFEGLGCGVELTEATVNKNEAGHGAFFFYQSAIAAGDDFAHGGEVVDAFYSFDLKLAVVGLFHGSVFPDDHGGHGFGTLDVGDVEALDAAGQLGKHECVLKGFLNGSLRGLHDAETLVETLAGVLAYEIDEGAFFSAQRDGDFYFVTTAFGEQAGESGAVGEIDGHVDGARYILLVDVQLLEQGGEEGSGLEGLV